jgi:hypothetical protein
LRPGLPHQPCLQRAQHGARWPLARSLRPSSTKMQPLQILNKPNTELEATPVNPYPWHTSQPHPTHQAEELRARTLRQSTESTMGLAGHLASTPATSWLPRLKAARSLNPPKEDHEDQLTTPKAQLHQHQPSFTWHSRAHKPAPLPPCWLPKTMAATLPNSAWRNVRAQHHQGESR